MLISLSSWYFDENSKLNYAVYKKDLFAVESLLKNGVDPNKKSFIPIEITPYAYESWLVFGLCYTILYKVASYFNLTNNKRDTTLHIALNKQFEEKNQLKITEYLLDHGADINKQNKNGDTILHIAIQNSYFESAIKILQYKKIDVTKTNKIGDNAVHQLSYLPGTVFDMPYKSLWLELFESPVDINAPNKEGKKPHNINPSVFSSSYLENHIIHSIYKGKYNALSKLIIFDPTVSLHALSWAINLRAATALSTIENNIALKDYPPHIKDNLLHKAIGERFFPAVKTLLDNGANINSKDSMGLTPFEKAFKYYSSPLVASFLLYKGAETKNLNQLLNNKILMWNCLIHSIDNKNTAYTDFIINLPALKDNLTKALKYAAGKHPDIAAHLIDKINLDTKKNSFYKLKSFFHPTKDYKDQGYRNSIAYSLGKEVWDEYKKSKIMR